MYRCESCREVVAAGVKQVREVVEVRVHQHPAREEVNRVVKNGRVKWRDDPGGFGTQIVRERVVCPGCAP